MNDEKKNRYVKYKDNPIIFCPDCGDGFILKFDDQMKSDEWYCSTCERFYYEDEIRNRCAL